MILLEDILFSSILHVAAPSPIFSRAALCSLTGNILGLKSRGGRCAEDVQTMCG